MARDLILNIIMKARDRASAAFERVRNASSGLRGRLGELQRELSNLDRAQRLIVRRNELDTKMRQNTQAIMANRREMQELRNQIGRLGVPTREQAERLAKLTEESEKLRAAQSRNSNELEELNARLRSYGITARDSAAAQAQLNRRHDQMTEAIDRERQAVERLETARNGLRAAPVKAAAALGIAMTARNSAQAIGRGMSVPVKAYAQAENAGTELRMALMDNTGKVSTQYRQIDQLATRLGDRLPGTTADFKNLMTMLVRQGVSAKTILGGTGEAAALLAVQLKKPPEAAAEMAAKLQDATRATEKEMLGLMDSVQRLYYAGVEDNNILGAFAKLSPALDITKTKGEAAIKTFSPLIGMLDQAGLSGESAGNALRKVFGAVMNTGKIQKVLLDAKKLGTVAKDFDLDFTDGKGEFGGLENMYRQLAKMRNLTTEARLDLIKDIFGDDAETLQALNTMIEKGQAGYDEFAQKLAEQGSLNQRVDEQLGTLANLWDAAAGTFTNFTASMGEAIAPELKEAVKWISDINQRLSTWAEQNPETANTLMKVAAAVMVLLAGVSAVATAFAALVIPIAAAKFAWAALFSGAGMGSSAGILAGIFGWIKTLGSGLLAFGRIAFTFLLTNPFGWALLAVGTLVLLAANWERVKNAVTSGWNWLKGVLRDNPFLGALGGPVGLLLTLVANWDRFKATVSAAWENFKATLRDNPFIAALSAPIALINGLIDRFDNLAAKVRQMKDAVKNFDVKQRAAEAWGKMKNAVGFSRGGYTGHGGINEAAGIVHKGEVVFNQADVKRFGGWQALERLRTTGLTGASLNRANRFFGGGNAASGGGISRPRSQRQPESPAWAGAGGITINIHAGQSQTAQDIAVAVRNEIAKLQAAASRRANSSLRDRD